MFLVDVERQLEGIEARKKAVPTTLLAVSKPNRIYFWHHTPRNRWYFVLTDAFGDFPAQPMEYVRGGTVLPGRYLGARNPKQNYVMNQKGLWVPTFRGEQHYFWVDSEKPRIKSVEFLPGKELAKERPQ